MKTTATFTIFKARPVVLTAIAIAGLLVARPAFAINITPTHFVDITENSSTSLTVLYDLTDVTASVVALNSSDHWTLTFGSNFVFGTFNNFWTEPEDPNFVNVVFGESTNQLFVISDNPNTGGAFLDGTPQVQNGSVNNQQVFFSITVHDKGDAAVGVPESASTLTLFFLSLAVLLGVRRLRSGRFA